MTLKVMADNRVEISAKQDGAVYNVALGDKDFIIKGLGDEFAMSYTGLVVSVESGEAVLHGRHITADATEQITLPSNQSGYLVLRIDLTQVSGAEAMLYATPTLTNEEINWDGNIYDMPIATFTTSNTGVTNFEDVRKIKDSFYPTKVSELENDSNFALKSYVDAQDTALNNALNELKDHERVYLELGNNNIIDIRRKGKSIEIYINAQKIASGLSVVYSTLAERFRPKYNYTLGVFFDRSSPYTPIGSVWISNTGSVTIYKPTNTTSGYGHITYVIDE